MKKITFLLLLVAGLIPFIGVAQKRTSSTKVKKIEGGPYRFTSETTGFPSCNTSAWELQFEDEFNGSQLNTKYWKVPYQGLVQGYNLEQHGHKQWYANSGSTPALPISNNIVLEDGILKLLVKKETTPIHGSYVTDWSTNPPTKDSNDFEFSAAWLESVELYGYGFYEARCKLPKGKGMWPAFWLFKGENGLNFEIDIFEFWNENSCFGMYDESKLSKNPHFNIHSNQLLYPHDLTSPSDLYRPCQKWPETGFDDDFHVFGLLWDAYKIEWYIDGEKVRTAYRYRDKKGNPINCQSNPKKQDEWLEASYWPNTTSMDVRFNIAVQYGKNNEPLSEDVFPKSFEIDYFRFYKQKSTSPIQSK